RQYDPAAVRATLRAAFGTEGVWVPISQRVRRLMREQAGYPEPHAELWTPLIETAEEPDPAPVWRGGEGRQPVVGRHCRDHYTKWPAAAATIRAAYCAGSPCSVRLLGGAEHAEKLLG